MALPAREHLRGGCAGLAVHRLHWLLHRSGQHRAPRTEAGAQQPLAPHRQELLQALRRAALQQLHQQCFHLVAGHVSGTRQQLLLAAGKMVISGTQRRFGQLGHLADAGGIEAHARQHLCRGINHALRRIRGSRAHGRLLAKTVVID
ncbi:hypothetical protein G6F68_011347 [Rhizopus microsporus]|nr:hypothetical protein G6F68_011347 [Rhizopus microsporus]